MTLPTIPKDTPSRADVLIATLPLELVTAAREVMGAECLDKFVLALAEILDKYPKEESELLMLAVSTALIERHKDLPPVDGAELAVMATAFQVEPTEPDPEKAKERVGKWDRRLEIARSLIQ